MSLVRSLPAAFFSPSFYRTVAHEWPLGRAITLLIMAIGIGWLVQMGILRHSGIAWLEQDGARGIERMPTLTLRAAVLSADPPGPHEFVGTAGEYLVIDTSGATTSLKRNGTLLTATQLVTRRPADTRVYELSSIVEHFGIEDGPITKENVRKWATAAVRWLPVIGYPFAVVGALGYRLVHAVILALAGSVLGRFVGARLSFSRLFVVAVVCLVPLVLIEHAASSTAFAIPGWGAALLAIAYVSFALHSARPSVGA